MSILNSEDFMKKQILKDNTMKKAALQRVCNSPIYPRDSKMYSDRGFVIIDGGRIGGGHWTCFFIKDYKSYYFDSFEGTPDKFLLKHLPKLIIYRNYKKED